MVVCLAASRLTMFYALVRQRAETYDAQELLKACDEFEMKNAGPIRRLESPEDHERTRQVMLDAMYE
jgi:hypothetical protein